MTHKTFAKRAVALSLLGLVACEASPTGANPSTVKNQSAQPSSASSCSLETPLKPGIPGSPDNPIKSEINPNGDSELAHLMRKMLKDLQEVRPLVLGQNQVNTPVKGHERIRCSWPSDPGIRGPLFGSLSDTYLATLGHFETQTTPNIDSYNGVVAACLGCHSNFCPGPIHLIQNLWIESPTTRSK